MSGQEPCAAERVDLRKYPNRRYYDPTQSRHVTLEEIRTMICSGSDVHITDSKTGEDITTKVLAQIILEQDPLKLAVFPVKLLHQLIRANEPLIRDFVDKYFNEALSAFLESQRQFDRYLRQALGLQGTLPTGREWARLMMGPFAPGFFSNGEENGWKGRDESAQEGTASGDKDLRQLVHELKEQVNVLKQELAQQKRRRSNK